MKENIRISENMNEKNSKELNESKHINTNLNWIINSLKLEYDKKKVKYKNQINEYENN